MAVSDTQTGKNEALPRVDSASEAARRNPGFPAIRWGAVFAGVAVGISIQLALTLLGIATGLSSARIGQGNTVGMGPLIWAGFSMLVAAFFGGYVAARMSGLKRKADGVLHGAVSWAVTTILFAVLATTVGGTLVSGVFSNMSDLARAAAPAGETPLQALMRNQGAHFDTETMKQLQQYLENGQRKPAVQLMVHAMGIPPSSAEAVADQALVLIGSANAASPRGRAQAENAMQAAGSAAWVVFIAVALALAIGIFGGALGAAGARRVSWASGGPVRR